MPGAIVLSGSLKKYNKKRNSKKNGTVNMEKNTHSDGMTKIPRYDTRAIARGSVIHEGVPLANFNANCPL
ncbi:MAG TPA: hypothetical protein ENN76_00270 [Euryarchaeota archaeon]|nr:hypothetical protein [Euryarchaeota archaeon]